MGEIGRDRGLSVMLFHVAGTIGSISFLLAWGRAINCPSPLNPQAIAGGVPCTCTTGPNVRNEYLKKKKKENASYREGWRCDVCLRSLIGARAFSFLFQNLAVLPMQAVHWCNVNHSPDQ